MKKRFISAFVLAVSVACAFSVVYRAGFAIPQPDPVGNRVTASVPKDLDGQTRTPRRPVRRGDTGDTDE